MFINIEIDLENSYFRLKIFRQNNLESILLCEKYAQNEDKTIIKENHGNFLLISFINNSNIEKKFIGWIKKFRFYLEETILDKISKNICYNCEKGFYADKGLNKCLKCHKSCKTCYEGGEKNDCTSCFNKDYFFQIGKKNKFYVGFCKTLFDKEHFEYNYEIIYNQGFNLLRNFPMNANSLNIFPFFTYIDFPSKIKKLIIKD